MRMQNMQGMEIVSHVHDEVIIECTPNVSVGIDRANVGIGRRSAFAYRWIQVCVLYETVK